MNYRAKKKIFLKKKNAYIIIRTIELWLRVVPVQYAIKYGTFIITKYLGKCNEIQNFVLKNVSLDLRRSTV